MKYFTVGRADNFARSGVWAPDAESAALQWVRIVDAETDYAVAAGEPVDIEVRGDEVKVFRVTGRMERVYEAKESNDGKG